MNTEIKKKEKLPLIKSSKSYKIVIPKEVERKIRHLCSVVHDVEWSGVLFYRYTGSFENDDFEVTCVDILPMDIGSSAYTEFDESPDVITYRIDNDLLDENIMEGLIHSHNNMSTFFSGTDQSTLVEEGTNVNHFVSLIVNNAGTYTAGVTRKITTESEIKTTISAVETKYYDSYHGQRVEICKDEAREETKEETTKKQVIEWFDLDIIKEDVDSFRTLDERLAEIRKSKVKPITTYKKEPLTKPTTTKYPPLWRDEYEDFYLDDEWGTPYDRKDYDWKSSKVSTDIHCDKEFIKKTATQLLTGCITIDVSKINLEKWVTEMDKVYNKLFDDDKDIDDWVSLMLEYLLYKEDKTLKKYSSIDTTELMAKDLIEYLETLPKSNSKDIIIDCLMKYITI